MNHKRFLIVGLGVLGRSLARTLTENGCEVIAIDESQESIEQVKDELAVAICCNATDDKALKQIGAADVDAAVVCIGEGFENAVLATAHLLDLGVKYVAARANSKVEESILRRLGAHEIFSVESQVGKSLGDKLSNPSVLTETSIGDGYQILQWEASKKIDGKVLKDMELPKHFGVQVMALRRMPSKSMETPVAETVLSSGDQLFIVGHEDKLKNFLGHWN